MPGIIDPADALRLFELIEPNLHRPYPYKPQWVLNGDADTAPPRRRAPIFFGCFDWHSAVHSHWAVARLRRTGAGADWIDRATALLDRSLRAESVALERATLEDQPGFGIPYALAWLLTLAAELGRGDAQARAWRSALAPLEQLAAARLSAWLRRLPCPVRDGQHSQSAFSMGLALDWARATGDHELASLIEERSQLMYGADADGPIGYEPSAYDFLSPCLAEADLMARVLEPAQFARWLARFLPRLSDSPLAPVRAVDREDGKLAHFDGLNFSRAWMLARIAGHLPDPDPRRDPLARAAAAHAAAGMASLDHLSYAGTHWVGSFALYWLTLERSR